MPHSAPPTIIIGAGLTGLSCARHLVAAGKRCLVLDAADAPGGRVRTNAVDGFKLDRGFQVYLTSYREPPRLLDIGALELGTFSSGALVHDGSRRRRIVDAWRNPLRAASTLLRPALPLGDIPRVLKLRRDALRADADGSSASIPAQTALEHLRARGFSERALQGFFRPFFCGVTLDPDLAIPAWYFHYLFAHFARGSAALPKNGMQAIPDQLAAGLPAGTVQLGVRVRKVARDGSRQITTESNETIPAGQVIIATDARSAADWIRDDEGGSSQSQGTGSSDPKFRGPKFHGTTTLYYSAPQSLVGEPTLMLDGTGGANGPVNHLCFPTDVQPSYGPGDAALASVSVIGVDHRTNDELDIAVRRQLDGWFGAGATAAWRLLHVDRVHDALPEIGPGPAEGCRRLDAGLILCGDQLQTPSIDGAMLSGRQAAEMALQPA